MRISCFSQESKEGCALNSQVIMAPPPSSIAPSVTSQLSMWPPNSTTSSGRSDPLISTIRFLGQRRPVCAHTISFFTFRLLSMEISIDDSTISSQDPSPLITPMKLLQTDADEAFVLFVPLLFWNLLHEMFKSNAAPLDFGTL